MSENWDKDSMENLPKIEEPKVETPQPKVEMPQPKVEIPQPRVEIPQPKVEMPQPRVEMPRPKVEMPQPRVGAPQPRVEAPQPRVEIPQPKVDAPAPVTYERYKFSKEEKKAPKEKKAKSGTGRKFALCIALAVVFGLVSGAVFQGVNTLAGHYGYGAKVEEVPTIPETVPETVDEAVEATPEEKPVTKSVDVSGAGSVAEVAANAMPSVVAISNVEVQEVPSYFGTREIEGTSSGSGIIVGQNDTELLVATNNHVVATAKTITVTFIDNNSVEAQIKGTDPDNDLAVVAVNVKDIQESTLAEIKVATIGDSDNLVVGEQVVAIGNALGYGQSVTSGCVSALEREIEIDDSTIAKLIQTDAAINPGNSGGALLNMHGELIGINSAKLAADIIEGMGYAIPVSTAEPILGELMNRTTRAKVDSDQASYLGISCREVSSETADMYDMPIGVFVAEVTSGTAAERAGMQKGDIIIKFDGKTIKTYRELVDTLTYYPAGEEVDIVIARAEAGEYTNQTLTVTLDERPADVDEQDEEHEDMPEGQEGFNLPW